MDKEIITPQEEENDLIFLNERPRDIKGKLMALNYLTTPANTLGYIRMCELWIGKKCEVWRGIREFE